MSVGVGIVGLGVGAGYALDAASKKSQYQEHQVNGACIDDQVRYDQQGCRQRRYLSRTVGSVAGGVLGAAGVVLWLTAPNDDSAGRAIALVPMAGQQGIGAAVSGGW